jgi:hypothetical protein
MSIKNIIIEMRQKYPEIDDYFRLRPELEIALFSDAIAIEKLFAIAPSFAALLEKTGLKEEVVKAFNAESGTFESGSTARLLAQVFGHPWNIKGLSEIIHESLKKDEECDKKGSCGDCECSEGEEDDTINVVVMPNGELAYGVSDEPLTIQEEIDFFDTLRESASDVVAAVAEANHDVVNHPKHYTSHPSGVECIEISEKLSFNLGNAFKYVFRRNDKENAYQDLSKAEWYLKREIGRLEGLLEHTPGAFISAIHPALTIADLRKVERIIAAESSKNVADFYANLFEQWTIQDLEDLNSLHDALVNLQKLMEETRRKQDEEIEKDPLGEWVKSR